MIRWRRQINRDRPLVVHLTTTDISLALLLGGQLEALQRSGYEVVGISAPGPFVAQIEALGVEHVPLHNSTRSLSLWADVRAAWELWRILRRLRPDVVHTHNPKPGVYGRIVAAMAGVPVIVNTVHGLYATPEDPLVRRVAVYFLERLAASFSDAELVQNPEDLDTLRWLRVPTDRLHLLGNGIDLSRFSPESIGDDQRARARAELGASTSSVVVLAVGRLVWEKGYRELFEAAQQVIATCPEALFAVVGPVEPSKSDGIQQSDLDRAAEMGVRFLGHREDVEALYRAADIYVLASHREGFPRSAMEAAAMGLPIVATNIRGCRQVVDDGKTGKLVAVHDGNALAQAITTLVDDPVQRSLMGEAGRLKARRDFDQLRGIMLIREVYEQLLKR